MDLRYDYIHYIIDDSVKEVLLIEDSVKEVLYGPEVLQYLFYHRIFG